MPTILLKKSDTPSAVPSGTDLTNLAGGAEVAVNTADKRMFAMNSSSAVIELGTNPSSITITNVNGGTPANGELLIGNGTGLTRSTLTAGTGISIANAPGSITISATSVTGPILESDITISENYSLTLSKNGLSVGPVTVDAGYTVTVPSGQRWVVI